MKRKKEYETVDCFTTEKAMIKEQKKMQADGLTARKKVTTEEGKKRFCIESIGPRLKTGRK